MKIRSLAIFTIMAALAAGANAQTLTNVNSTTTKTTKNPVSHDATLQGDGTTTAPLGVAAPLNLGGALNVSGDSSVSGNSSAGGSVTAGGGIKATTATGSGVEATGGANDANLNSSGVKATGGVNQNAVGGIGVEARGGQGINGGVGVEGSGGDALDTASGFVGGIGVRALGGINAGTGLQAIGGDSPNSFNGGVGAIISGGKAPAGDGGTGMFVQGGIADGSGHTSGGGIVVRAGVAFNGSTRGHAADFDGDVHIDSGNLLVDGNLTITGNVAKGSGSFKIDHPLDPENKFLSHSFVESPDMMNIYNGTITTDAKGNAIVTLPEWFEALNQDFRYQLTVIGTFAQAMVAQEIKGNRFTVKTSTPNVKVSWQVTGIRHDAYANMHRIAVEEPKAEGERGLYLHPDAFDQPQSKSIHASRVAPQTDKMSATDEPAGQGSQQ